MNTQNAWGLFIDDERQPEKAGSFFSELQGSVAVARTVDEATKLVESRGVPALISFDHDLGENQPSASVFMWYLISKHLDKELDLSAVQKIQAHSANPVEARNLVELWNGFAMSEDLSVKAERCFI